VSRDEFIRSRPRSFPKYSMYCMKKRVTVIATTRRTHRVTQRMRASRNNAPHSRVMSSCSGIESRTDIPVRCNRERNDEKKEGHAACCPSSLLFYRTLRCEIFDLNKPTIVWSSFLLPTLYYYITKQLTSSHAVSFLCPQ